MRYYRPIWVKEVLEAPGFLAFLVVGRSASMVGLEKCHSKSIVYNRSGDEGIIFYSLFQVGMSYTKNGAANQLHRFSYILFVGLYPPFKSEPLRSYAQPQPPLLLLPGQPYDPAHLE